MLDRYKGEKKMNNYFVNNTMFTEDDLREEEQQVEMLQEIDEIVLRLSNF